VHSPAHRCTSRERAVAQRCCLGILAAACAAEPALADSITLTASRDATLFEDAVDYASGAASFLFAGPIASGSPRRALLHFDLSAIPTNAVVTAVSLRVVVNRSAPGSGADAFQLHRVAASWGEGGSDGGTGGGGTQATAGDSTWRSRFHGAPPSVPQVTWAVPGGEFAPLASAVVTFNGNDPYTFGPTAALIDDVRVWLATPAVNHGWVLIGPEGDEFSKGARRLISRESPSVNDRPQLTIDYTLPPSPTQVPMIPRPLLLLAGGMLALIATRRARGGIINQ
jgi:hypothetical protein